MELGALGQKVVRFGLFEADLQQRVLTKGGMRIRLQDQPFQVLALLLERPGELVSRDEIQRKLWPADTYVAFDDGLNTAIKKLRAALSDTPDNPRFIETVPRRGYRFVAPVAIPTATTVAAESDSAESTSENVVIAARERSRVVVEPIPSTLPKLGIWAAAALVLALGGAGYVYQSRHRATRGTNEPNAAPPTPAIRMRPSVAVLGFRNLSQGSDEVWLSTALSEMLNTELSAGERLRMIPGEDISRGKADLSLVDSEALAKETLTRVRAELGADYVVLGSYTAVGQTGKRRVRLDLRLQDTRAGETIAEESVTGREEELFDIVSDAGTRLRMRFDVAALNNEEAVRVRASLPSNVEAARLYAEGLTKLRSFDALQARDLLTKAAAVDPKNAMIHTALAAAWSRLGYDAKSKLEAKQALDLATSLAREDRLSVEGRYHEAARDWPAAIESYRTLWNLFPDNLDYGLQLASAQVSAGLAKDALITVDAMRKLPAQGNPDPRIDLTETAAAELLGDFSRSDAAAVKAAKGGELQHSQLVAAKALAERGWVLERLGKFDEARDALKSAKSAFTAAGDRAGAARANAMLGELLQDRGDMDGALRAFEDTIRTCREVGDLRCVGRTINALGGLRRDQNDDAAAEKYFEQVLAISRETGNPAGIAAALGNLANVLDDMGRLADEEKMQQQALDIFTEMGDKRGIGTTSTNLANVLENRGKLDQALTLVDRAIAVHREIGFKRGLSFALSSRADILAQQDHLADARQAQSEALEIRKALGTPKLLEMSLAQSAFLSLEENDPSEAESAAEQAIQQIEGQKEFDLEAMARALLAKSLVAQKNLHAARQAADQALALATNAGDRLAHLEATLASATVNAASGKSADARRELTAVIGESSKFSYELYRFEARLALYQLDLRSPQSAEARKQLSALKNEANAKGFNLIARKAAAN